MGKQFRQGKHLHILWIKQKKCNWSNREKCHRFDWCAL